MRQDPWADPDHLIEIHKEQQAGCETRFTRGGGTHSEHSEECVPPPHQTEPIGDDDMVQITNHTEGPDQWILVNFPRLNKQHHIEDNDAEIRADIVARDSFPMRCKIVRTIRLSDDEFERFSVSMLEDRDEWFEGTGGSRSDVEMLQDKSWHDISTDLGLTQMWYASSYIPVVRVMRAARQWAGPDIYVNCEGHKYARYVGRDARVNWTLDSTTAQGGVPTS